MVVEIAVAAVLGALIGSFLNVVIYRLPRGESLRGPGLALPRCEQPIKPYDNVPVLSWLVLRGKCRNCGAAHLAALPDRRAADRVAFAAIASANGVDTDLICELPFAAMLIAVAAIDLEHRIVPNKILLPIAVFGVVATATRDSGDLPEL